MYISLKNKSKECGLEFKIVPSEPTNNLVIQGNFLKDTKNYTLINNEFYACLGPSTGAVDCNESVTIDTALLFSFNPEVSYEAIDSSPPVGEVLPEDSDPLRIFIEDVDITDTINSGLPNSGYSLIKITPEFTGGPNPLFKFSSNDFKDHIVEIKINPSQINPEFEQAVMQGAHYTAIGSSLFFCLKKVTDTSINCYSDIYQNIIYPDNSIPFEVYVNGIKAITSEEFLNSPQYEIPLNSDVILYRDSSLGFNIFNSSSTTSHLVEFKYTDQISEELFIRFFDPHYSGTEEVSIPQNISKVGNNSIYICLSSHSQESGHVQLN